MSKKTQTTVYFDEATKQKVKKQMLIDFDEVNLSQLLNKLVQKYLNGEVVIEHLE